MVHNLRSTIEVPRSDVLGPSILVSFPGPLALESEAENLSKSIPTATSKIHPDDDF